MGASIEFLIKQTRRETAELRQKTEFWKEEICALQETQQLRALDTQGRLTAINLRFVKSYTKVRELP